jgi:hypothetical protein
MEACQIHKFKPGDVLSSEAWIEPRVLRHYDKVGAVLAALRPDGTMKAEVITHTLPADVHKVDHPVRSIR